MSTRLRTEQLRTNDWMYLPPLAWVSTDGSTSVVNATGDLTSILSPGMRLKVQQSQVLTAYWNLDANSNSQVGSFNGTDTSITYTAGKFSNAATFNGTTSKIVIADNAALKPTGEFTIGCWFKKTGAGTQKSIFSSSSANTNFAGILLTVEATNILRLQIGNNTAATAVSNFLGTINVADNAYHYCVVSHRNNYVQVYLDGKLETYGYMVTPVYAATNYVRVGCFNAAGSDSLFFDGQIDDLFLINGYALDEKTIKKQYDLQAAQGTGNITIDKYTLITNVASYGAGVTPITIWGGTDYSLQNTTITNPFYATVARPFGFPIISTKWTVEFSNTIDASQATPTGTVWYNLGLSQITIPIGAWTVKFKVVPYAVKNLNLNIDVFSTLSTGNSTESNTKMTGYSYCNQPTAGSGAIAIASIHTIEDIFITSSKVVLYLNIKTNTVSATTMFALNSTATPTIIRAISNYL